MPRAGQELRNESTGGDMALDQVRALTFDVFGTVVDWRSSIIREGADWEKRYGIKADWAAFAGAWRARYQPGLERVRSGAAPWTKLDDLHRGSLLELIKEFGLTGLD